ncbi:DEAD/DEAH box helicase [Blastochloris viridis]|uniref:DEAD-box ATP-dependent RNA helicase RhpA n=1 Tax=Blastochloris viridis TaxID=1079 RepID=A0A0H5BD69_BLAVI|nr:DEAD/DEAH box helicase [Blastochloris viridis]BAR99054.1 ATP-dependent RNA helicase RhlE [Blastochloris viridis]CUU43623.1 ATP-dependent RNA helicase rhlE [Blastochloris viridis]
MTEFSTLGLAAPILRALAEANHTHPTPIQLQAVPPVLAGRDLVGIAQTGTGKTAAFALPILNRLATHPGPARPDKGTVRALILAPTRELAGQILDSVKIYGRHLRLKTALAIGGVSINPQIKALAHGVDVLVATPGRLMDLHNQRAVRLDRVEVLVLDEADQMLDMGFIQTVRRIVGLLPAHRQSLLFSATMPKEIESLAAKMMREPVQVAVNPVAKTADRIDQRVLFVDKAAKTAALVDVLSLESVDRALVFARTKHGADRIVRALDKAGLPAAAIHGNKSQNQRERVLAAFRSGSVRTLVATDIAARGIDVAGISHVVNFDLPNVPESYVHRIGRTARAGAAGVAISLCDAEERPYLKAIENLIRCSIPTVDKRGEVVARAEPFRRDAAAAADASAPTRTKPVRSRSKRRPGSAEGRQAGGVAVAPAKTEQRPAGKAGRERVAAPSAPAAAAPRAGRPAQQGAPTRGKSRSASREPASEAGFASMAFMRPVRRPRPDERASAGRPTR